MKVNGFASQQICLHNITYAGNKVLGSQFKTQNQETFSTKIIFYRTKHQRVSELFRLC